jgi:butyryl-CoA dehydrogenase
MDLRLTSEQQLLQDTTRAFVQKEIAPKAAELDQSGRFPEEIVRRMAEMGLTGVYVPAESGGAGMDVLSYILAVEEVSRGCASCGVIMSVNNSLVCDPLMRYGTSAQKEEILAPLARGDILGCFALSEPGSGSDSAAMQTTARRDGGGWILSGAKNFITNAPQATWAIVFAKSTPASGHKGISAFLVNLKDTPGVTVGPKEKKLGIHAAWSSSIYFEDARIGVDRLLGSEGEGFRVAMTTLDGGRIGIAAQAIGIAQSALDESVLYAKDRSAFGGKLADLQAIQFMIADMATETDAARLLTYRAASLKDAGQPYGTESAIAKLVASETATRVTHKAIQIHGGYGYLQDFPAERHYRDARITEIYEGTSEIQRIVIARSLLRA